MHTSLSVTIVATILSHNGRFDSHGQTVDCTKNRLLKKCFLFSHKMNSRFDSHGQAVVCPTILADNGRYDTYGQTAIVREFSVFC